MALPVTVSGASLLSVSGVFPAPLGPYKSSGGNYYTIGWSGADSKNLRAIKASDPTSSFSAVGTDPTPVAGQNAFGIAGYQVGDVVHIAASVWSVSSSVTFVYYTFDMSTDAWSSSETIQSGVDIRTSGLAAPAGLSIVVRSDGTVVVLYNGPRVANMGSSYSRVVYARRTSGGSWSLTNQAVDSGGTVDWVNPEAVLGSSDRTHFFWYQDAGATVNHRALTSADAIQTASTAAGGLSATRSLQGVSYDDGGTQRVAVLGDDGTNIGCIYFNSANTATLNVGTEYAGTEPQRLFNDGTDVYAVYRKAADSDLYVRKSTDHGATFGAESNIFTATVSAANANLSIDGNIYQRGSDYVIAYVVNDNGTLKYNEYVVRSVSSNKTLAAAAGSYAFTGTAASVLVKRKVVADAGSYSFTGSAATLRRNIPVVAGAGSYAFSGTAASVLHKWIVTAGAGSYAFTGTNANLNKGQRLTADAGGYAFTGTAASVFHNWKVAAGAGSYTFTGTNATLTRNITVIAGAGSYAFSGTAASVLHGWKVTAAAGSYAFTGTDASILHNWKLTAGAGAYAFTGTDAAVTKVVNKTLAADAGSYSFTGTSASVLHGWKVTAGAGSYSFTGTDAAITTAAAKTVVAGAGSYSFSGTAASVLHNWKVTAGAGSYAFSGTAASIFHNWKVAANAGSYAFTGAAASVVHGWKVSAGVGAYNFTGAAAALNKGVRLTADVGSYTFSGTSAGVALLRKIAADAGSYLFSGSDADITVIGTEEPTQRRGTGGWGAGLHGPKRQRGLPIPLSRRDRKLSDLDELPPKPVIVKASVETPATVLAPLIGDEDDLRDILELQDLGLLN